MKPTIYTTPDCPYCHDLTDWLESKNIPYEQIDASEMDEIEIVPEIHIGDEIIIGPDYRKIQKALKKHGISTD